MAAPNFPARIPPLPGYHGSGTITGPLSGGIPGQTSFIGYDPRNTGFGGNQGGSGILGGIWDWIKNNPEVPLAVLAGVQGARQGGRSDDLLNEALAMSRQRYEDRAPFRAQLQERGSAGAFTPIAAPNFSAAFADAGNPYSRSAPSTQPVAGDASAPGGARLLAEALKRAKVGADNDPLALKLAGAPRSLAFAKRAIDEGGWKPTPTDVGGGDSPLLRALRSGMLGRR